MSTTYSSQGKTAEQVLADIDSTLSKEGLYVAVSRTKSTLKLYTADKQQLYKRAQRSVCQNNPSDYLPLFKLVNPHAENQKAAKPARELRGADQPEYVGDSAGECIALSHRAAVRRDSRIESGSEPAPKSAGRVTAEYVSEVRSVATGIEERCRAADLAQQAERLGQAVGALVPVVEQLELTAAALTRLADQVERKSKRLVRRRRAHERTSVGGVAEAVFRSIDPDLLERARDHIAKNKVSAPSQPLNQQREIYQRYASKFSDRSPKECDRLVACQLMDKLLKARSGQRLNQDERVRVG